MYGYQDSAGAAALASKADDCSSPFLGTNSFVIGRCVNGRRSRSCAAPRGSAIDSVAASWTMMREEGGDA